MTFHHVTLFSVTNSGARCTNLGIYSDIFVERGKQSVLENTLRLSEIDNTGLLGIYGNGYFNIKKQ